MSGCKLLTYARICSLLLPPCACLFLSHYKKVLPFVEGSTAMYKSSDGTYKMPVGAYNAQTGEYTTRRRSMAPTPKVRASCRHGSEWREADYGSAMFSLPAFSTLVLRYRSLRSPRPSSMRLTPTSRGPWS